MSTVKAILPGADFLFMARFASTDPGRLYLGGVHIEAGPLLVSADGYRMGIMRLGPEEGYFAGEPFILAADKNLLLTCKCGAREQTVVICRDDSVSVVKLGARVKWGARDMLTYAGDAVSFPAQSLYVDGTFPNWRRVVPKPEVVQCLDRAYALNAAYLASFQASKERTHVNFCGTNHGSPMLVTNSDPRFVGVLMPIHGASLAEITARRNAVIGDETAAAQAAE